MNSGSVTDSDYGLSDSEFLRRFATKKPLRHILLPNLEKLNSWKVATGASRQIIAEHISARRGNFIAHSSLHIGRGHRDGGVAQLLLRRPDVAGQFSFVRVGLGAQVEEAEGGEVNVGGHAGIMEALAECALGQALSLFIHR